MAVLIAGIGYIGAKLASDLLSAGEEVVAIDNFFATDPLAVRKLAEHPNCRLIEGRFGDRHVLAQAFRRHDVVTVYALAAQSSPYCDAALARYTETTNLLAPRRLLDAMRRYGCRSIVFGSSLKVYGDADPTTGEDAGYGTIRDLSHLSKCYVEKLLEMYAENFGLRCLAVRLGNAYGVSPVMKTDYRFITAPNKFCRQIALGEAVELYPGSERLTGFIHVADASRALQSLASHQAFDGYYAVNAATEWAQVGDVAAIVRHIAVNRSGLPPAAALPKTLHAVGKRLAATGFQPRHTLASSLGEVLEHFSGPAGAIGTTLGSKAVLQ